VSETIPEENLAANALAHLKAILLTAELDAEATEEAQGNDTLTLAVIGPEASLLVGQYGQTLDALQYLLMLMTNKGQAGRIRITVDADSYRARRARKLTDFANELAAQVGKSGQEAVTDSLNPMERRIIHTALADHPDVETYSEGDEPNRYVVVTPRRDEAKP
jgi:spoIIIJ-associated protein